jgi:hypothetical protein
MNERIQELAREATIDIKDQYGHWIGSELDEEKFARLIVIECAGLFPKVYVEIETDYGHTPVIAADYIKKHFGVEE